MLLDFCAAYRLLEDYGQLKPGDAVIFNDGGSAIGQILIQMCQILKLGAIAVVTEAQARDEKLEMMLKDLGADCVYVDRGSTLQQQMQSQRAMHARPKLALDCIGGQSALRLADTLQVFTQHYHRHYRKTHVHTRAHMYIYHIFGGRLRSSF